MYLQGTDKLQKCCLVVSGLQVHGGNAILDSNKEIIRVAALTLLLLSGRLDNFLVTS